MVFNFLLNILQNPLESTIGDPMCDIANLSMMFLIPGKDKMMPIPGIAGELRKVICNDR